MAAPGYGKPQVVTARTRDILLSLAAGLGVNKRNPPASIATAISVMLGAEWGIRRSLYINVSGI